ncbi:MAG: hypothetical protein IIB05_04665 [Bacteroidetes bacterium]|nr:hypothetical protein [Bacteroidota bacterium]
MRTIFIFIILIILVNNKIAYPYSKHYQRNVSQDNIQTDITILLEEAIELYNTGKKDGKFEASTKLFNKIIQLDQKNVTAHFYLGEINFLKMEISSIFRKKKYGDIACKKFEIVVKLDPKHHKAHHYLGRMYHMSPIWYEDLREKAIEEFKIALKIKPESIETLRYLAMAYEKYNDVYNARIIWKRLLKLKPDDKETQERLKNLSK